MDAAHEMPYLPLLLPGKTSNIYQQLTSAILDVGQSTPPVDSTQESAFESAMMGGTELPVVLGPMDGRQTLNMERLWRMLLPLSHAPSCEPICWASPLFREKGSISQELCKFQYYVNLGPACNSMYNCALGTERVRTSQLPVCTQSSNTRDSRFHLFFDFRIIVSSPLLSLLSFCSPALS